MDVSSSTVSQEEEPMTRVVGKKPRDRDYVLRRTLLASDLAALCLAFVLATFIGGAHQSFGPDGLLFLLTLPGWALLFRTYALYSRPVRSFEPTHLDDLSHLFHAMVIGTLALWVFYKLVQPSHQLILEEIAIFWLLGLGFIAVFRWVIRKINLKRQGPERVFLVATEPDYLVMKRKLGNHPEYEMELVGVIADALPDSQYGLPLAASVDEIESLLATKRIDHLIVRLDSKVLSEGQAEELMYACFRHGARFGAYPGPVGLLLPGVQLNHIEGMGILTHDPPNLSRSDRLMKRLLDVAVSSALIVLTAPFMIVATLAIKVDSKGPVLFRQVRVGRDGVRFRLNKFRTMVPDADAMTAQLMEKSLDPNWLTLEEDPRVTRVGRFLRRTSADELPQLWNVLKGEMSMVGPRPLAERDDEGLRGWERHRLDLVPGLTGHWQVLGRTSIPFKEMVEIDYAYVTGWSLWLDLKILMRTVPIVLTRRGAN